MLGMMTRFWEIGLTVYDRYQIQPTRWWNDLLPFREHHLTLGWCSYSLMCAVSNSCGTAASLSHDIDVWLFSHVPVPWEWEWQNCTRGNVCARAQAHGAVAIPWESVPVSVLFQGESLLVLGTAGTQGVLQMFSISNDNKKTIAISWNISSRF